MGTSQWLPTSRKHISITRKVLLPQTHPRRHRPEYGPNYCQSRAELHEKPLRCSRESKNIRSRSEMLQAGSPLPWILCSRQSGLKLNWEPSIISCQCLWLPVSETFFLFLCSSPSFRPPAGSPEQSYFTIQIGTITFTHFLCTPGNEVSLLPIIHAMPLQSPQPSEGVRQDTSDQTGSRK